MLAPVDGAIAELGLEDAASVADIGCGGGGTTLASRNAQRPAASYTASIFS